MNKVVVRLAVLVALAPLAVACAPVVGNHGFQVIDVNPKDIVIGTDTKSTVLAQLGSPSAVSTFEDNIWYYISQTTERYTYNRPQVSQRSVTAITFNEADDKVAEVRNLNLEDGQQIAMERRETPTFMRPEPLRLFASLRATSPRLRRREATRLASPRSRSPAPPAAAGRRCW